MAFEPRKERSMVAGCGLHRRGAAVVFLAHTLQAQRLWGRNGLGTFKRNRGSPVMGQTVVDGAGETAGDARLNTV